MVCPFICTLLRSPPAYGVYSLSSILTFVFKKIPHRLIDDGKVYRSPHVFIEHGNQHAEHEKLVHRSKEMVLLLTGSKRCIAT